MRHGEAFSWERHQGRAASLKAGCRPPGRSPQELGVACLRAGTSGGRRCRVEDTRRRRRACAAELVDERHEAFGRVSRCHAALSRVGAARPQPRRPMAGVRCAHARRRARTRPRLRAAEFVAERVWLLERAIRPCACRIDDEYTPGVPGRATKCDFEGTNCSDSGPLAA